MKVVVRPLIDTVSVNALTLNGSAGTPSVVVRVDVACRLRGDGTPSSTNLRNVPSAPHRGSTPSSVVNQLLSAGKVVLTPEGGPSVRSTAPAGERNVRLMPPVASRSVEYCRERPPFVARVHVVVAVPCVVERVCT